MINRKDFVRDVFKNIPMPSFLISEDVGYVEYNLDKIVEELSEKFPDDDDEEWCELISGICFLTLSNIVYNEKERFLQHIREDQGITLEELIEQFVFSYESKEINNKLFTMVVGTLAIEKKIYTKEYVTTRFYTNE